MLRRTNWLLSLANGITRRKGAEEALLIYGHLVRVVRNHGVVVRVASLVKYATQGCRRAKRISALFVIKLDGDVAFLAMRGCSSGG